MHKYLSSLIVIVFVGFTGSAWANDAALQNCRLETSTEKRLACYDAIALGARAAPNAPGAPAAPNSSAAPGVTTTAPAAAATSNFGLIRVPSAQDSVESSIPGPFEGWDPKTRITLANGQVWAIADGSTASLRLNSPKVRVKSGTMSSFFMSIEGTNRSPRVKRVN